MDTMTYACAAEVTRTLAEIRRNGYHRLQEAAFTPLDLSLLRPRQRPEGEADLLTNRLLRRVLWEAPSRGLAPAFGHRP